MASGRRKTLLRAALRVAGTSLAALVALGLAPAVAVAALVRRRRRQEGRRVVRGQAVDGQVRGRERKRLADVLFCFGRGTC